MIITCRTADCGCYHAVPDSRNEASFDRSMQGTPLSPVLHMPIERLPLIAGVSDTALLKVATHCQYLITSRLCTVHGSNNCCLLLARPDSCSHCYYITPSRCCCCCSYRSTCCSCERRSTTTVAAIAATVDVDSVCIAVV